MPDVDIIFGFQRTSTPGIYFTVRTFIVLAATNISLEDIKWHVCFVILRNQAKEVRQLYPPRLLVLAPLERIANTAASLPKALLSGTFGQLSCGCSGPVSRGTQPF